MLRSVTSEAVTASSPKRTDLDTEDNGLLKAATANNAEIVFNLNKNTLKDKRKKKRSVNVSSGDEDEENEGETSGNVKDKDVLMDEDEARLEDLVFGNEKNIFENIKKNTEKKNRKAGLKFNQFLAKDDASEKLVDDKKVEIADEFNERKPVWEDDNDEDEK